MNRLVIAEIERRRSFVRATGVTSLQQDIDRVRRAAQASVRRESSLQVAWGRTAPPELAERCRAVALRGGVLTLAVKDQSSRYLVDRWIRGSGRASLATALGTGVTRVTINVSGHEPGNATGSPEGPTGAPPEARRRPTSR